MALVAVKAMALELATVLELVLVEVAQARARAVWAQVEKVVSVVVALVVQEEVPKMKS